MICSIWSGIGCRSRRLGGDRSGPHEREARVGREGGAGWRGGVAIDGPVPNGARDLADSGQVPRSTRGGSVQYRRLSTILHDHRQETRNFGLGGPTR